MLRNQTRRVRRRGPVARLPGFPVSSVGRSVRRRHIPGFRSGVSAVVVSVNNVLDGTSWCTQRTAVHTGRRASPSALPYTLALENRKPERLTMAAVPNRQRAIRAPRPWQAIARYSLIDATSLWVDAAQEVANRPYQHSLIEFRSIVTGNREPRPRPARMLPDEIVGTRFIGTFLDIKHFTINRQAHGLASFKGQSQLNLNVGVYSRPGGLPHPQHLRQPMRGTGCSGCPRSHSGSWIG